MKNKRLSKLQIAAKMKSKTPFIVTTSSERHDVLLSAKFLEINVQTKRRKEGGYSVTFPV